MITINTYENLGRFHNDWLSARYHFSFGDYYDPARQGLGDLLVWNDDTIQPGRGFDMHGHRDMEILTFVRQGAISHRDHLGNEGRTAAGDVQVMTAGCGILHAEYNLENEETRLFQIWIRPSQSRLAPNWHRARFPAPEDGGHFRPLASGRASLPAPLTIHQDAALLAANLKAAQSIRHTFSSDRQGYLVASSGRFTVNGHSAKAGDGIAVRNEDSVTIAAAEPVEILLADLAA